MSRWAGSKVRLHQPRDWAEGGMTASGRYCCKSLFALGIKNSAGCGCDFHVKSGGPHRLTRTIPPRFWQHRPPRPNACTTPPRAKPGVEPTRQAAAKINGKRRFMVTAPLLGLRASCSIHQGLTLFLLSHPQGQQCACVGAQPRDESDSRREDDHALS
jgi:hypothetical protein